MNKSLLIIYLLASLSWIWFTIQSLAIDLRFEDALIVLRYAENIVNGHGFVFNQGEQVLGVTTPLYTLISTLFILLGGEHAPALQNIAGVIALWFQALLVIAILNLWGYRLVAFPAAILILSNYNLNYLYLGMEVHFFASLLLLVVFLCAVRAPEWLIGAMLGISFLVRYDAALLALFVGLGLLISNKKLPWHLTLAFFVVVIPWLIFAQYYFGSIVPQPLSAKEGNADFFGYLHSVYNYYQETYQRVFVSLLKSKSVAETLAAYFFIPFGLGVMVTIKRPPGALLMLSYGIGSVLVYASIGSDPKFTWHFYILNPVGFLFFMVGLGAAGSAILKAFFTSTFSSTKVAYLSLACILVFSAPLLSRLSKQMFHQYQMNPHAVQLHEMAFWLRDNYSSSTSLLQPSIGILGYESKLRIIDHAGLVTPGLHYHDDIRSSPFERVLSRFAPDLILQPRESKNDPRQFGYKLVKEFNSSRSYLLWERNDL